MSEGQKTAIAKSFLDAYAKLPKTDQQRMSEFLLQFFSAPDRSDWEQMDACAWLAPIRDTLAAVVEEQDDALVLVWVMQRGAGDWQAERAEKERQQAAKDPAPLHFVEGAEDLRYVLAWPLDQWRVFLHPLQESIVAKDYSGPARVLGGAGTGKTVVAMHRARRLASQLKEGKVLFTTFTANLAADIQENLRKICTRDELARIEVVHIDTWAAAFLRRAGYPARILYDPALLRDIWEHAIAEAAAEELGQDAGFFAEEWHRVALPQHALTEQAYLRASRAGRGVALTRAKRKMVWQVFSAYQRQMKARGLRDADWAMEEARTIIEQEPQDGLYPHVIVDEAQDLSPVAMRLLRSLAGAEHKNDIFLAGDAHQRIYHRKVVLKHCGIRIQGRSSILRLNYRTTEETLTYAMALLRGLSFDDLDGGMLADDSSTSLLHGERPHVQLFRTAQEEIAAIQKEIRALTQRGVALQDICVTARSHARLASYREALAPLFPCYEIRRREPEDRHKDGLRLATMHRVKGLEFPYVFLCGASAGILPPKSVEALTDPVVREEAMTSERCLLYVALTRAQRKAYLFGVGTWSPFIKNA